MPPRDVTAEACPVPVIRRTPRVTRTAAALAFAVISGSALPALADGAPSLPGSCADVATSTPGAPDGNYRIELAGARTIVYCAGMASDPRGYLTLANTGGNTNYSGVIRPTYPTSNRTDFTRLRLVDRGDVVNGITCASDACVDTHDTSFSTSDGGAMRFAFAEGDGGLTGYGRVDLTGTPFAVGPSAFSLGGYMPSGSATYSTDDQVVDLVGSGGNGWIISTSQLLPLVRLSTPTMVPAAPAALHASRGDGSAQLSFSPGDDGGDAVTGYEVSTNAGAFLPLSTTAQLDGSRTGTVSGLTNGAGYSFVVRAINSVGTSADSATATTTPATTPAAPGSLVVTGTDGGATLSFTPGDDGGDEVTGYEVSTDGGSTFDPLITTPGTGGTLTGTVSGLANRTAYAFAVRASNGVGPGASATGSAIPSAAMTAPAGLVASPGDRSASLSFHPATGGPVPIARYEVSTGGTWTTLPTTAGPSGSLRASVPGLANGTTYTVSVRGVGAGEGPVATATVRPDPISPKYAALGGPSSVLGAAVGPEFSIAGGLGQRYQAGWIYWTPTTGAHEVHGHIAARYAVLGGPAGLLGFPLTDETGTPDQRGRFNHFAGADGSSIYWTPATGAWSVHGAIRNRWAAGGWERSPNGYPTTDETGTPDGVGRFNHFSGSGGSSIYWTPRTGAHLTYGAIRVRWASMGFERGRLGYPLTSEYAVGGGRRSDFAGGSILYSYASRRTSVLFR